MNEITEHFWKAAGEGHLTICRCGDCGKFRAPPTAFCANCLSKNRDWPILSGEAELYSFTVINRSRNPETPDYYVAAVVKLPDAPGVKLATNIVTADIDALTIGCRLRAIFEPMANGFAMPVFTPTNE